MFKLIKKEIQEALKNNKLIVFYNNYDVVATIKIKGLEKSKINIEKAKINYRLTISDNNNYIVINFNDYKVLDVR